MRAVSAVAELLVMNNYGYISVAFSLFVSSILAITAYSVTNKLVLLNCYR